MTQFVITRDTFVTIFLHDYKLDYNDTVTTQDNLQQHV